MFDTLLGKLEDNSWLTLETSPSKSALFQPLIDRLRALELHTMVDGWSVTDNPLAKLRYGSIFAAICLQRAFGKPALATVSMRDRNLIGIQSDLLGSNEFDIRAFLAVTGDSAALSDQPRAKGVFEANSIALLNIMSYFNRGIDYAGRLIAPAPKPIYPFAVTSGNAKNTSALKRKITQKVAAGAIGVISQPVFSIEDALLLQRVFDEATRDLEGDQKKAKLIIGLFPLARLKTAQFLQAHVPGVRVPDRWIHALFEANKISPNDEERVGLEISAELFVSLRRANMPVHIMTANHFEIAKKIISAV
ncbi:MAG: methylenetetrahydrofolate reductase [Helicobacteraceae bacterium]|nr:methylenetetrahydrofolate reductase [Helicobacteraceae bacterium]